MTEVDFPRGKYPGYKDSLAKKVPKRPAEDELFSTRVLNKDDDTGGDDEKTKSAKKSKRQKNKKSTSEEVSEPGVPSFDEKVVIYRLKTNNVAINSIILGCVAEIKDYEMSVQLPGAVLVKVSITNISEPYSKALVTYAQDPANNPSPPKPKSLFQPGDLLPVKILDKKESHMSYDDTSMSLTDIDASVNPRDVYSDLHTAPFLKNCANTSICAAVVEIEDHGYLMDIGRENIKGFMSFDDAKPFIEARNLKNLSVGQVILCNIISASQRVVKLTTKAIKPRNSEDSTFPTSCLLPGVTVTAKVLATCEVGLEVVVFGQHRGFVHKDHLKTIWDLPRDDYQVGEDLKGIILFVNPVNKVVALSLRSHPELSSLKKSWAELRIGQLIEKAQIVGKDSGGSFIFKFPNGFKGVAPKHELSDDFLGQEDLAVIETQLPIGSFQKCRIKSFSYLDGYAKVTLKNSLLEAEHLSVEDLKVGQVLEGRVKKLNKKGLIITLGFGLKAYCPTIHHKDSVKPKDYAAGSKLKCRIIRLDSKSLVPRIAVTCRKELIREKNIIDDFSKAVAGLYTRGIVVLIQENGLVIEFFNELRGFLSAKRFQKENLQYSVSSYSIGQILPVYVVQSDAKNEKIHLSLIYSEPEEESDIISSTPIGTILSDLTVVSKDADGFSLTNTDGDSFYLPKAQLSDYPGLIDKLHEVIQVDDTIEKVVVFKNTSNVPIVSRRAIFIQASEKENPVFKPETLNTGLVVPAIIKNFKVYGIIVECPGGMIGLIPTENISKTKVDPLESGFATNQTVLVHINHLKEKDDEKRLNCSSIISQCVSPDFPPEMILSNYLVDYTFIKSRLWTINNKPVTRALSSIKPGDILPFKVLKSVDEQALCACTVEGCKKPIPGIINRSKKKSNDGKVGQTGEGVVLYIDIEKKLVHLSVDQDLRKKASSAIKNSSYSRVSVGQVLISNVELTTDKFHIVSLKGHAIGALAYIPRYIHLNALKPDSNLYKNGQKLYFAVKEKLTAIDESSLIIGSKTSEKPTSVKNKEAEALLAKARKETLKKAMNMVENKIKLGKENVTKKGDDKNADKSLVENEDDDDESDPDEINFDSDEEEEVEMETDDDENQNNEKKIRKSKNLEEDDQESPSFFVDTEGISTRKTVKSNANDDDEDDDVSSVDDSDEDGVKVITPNILKKRKRKVSENHEDKLKEEKKKHFKKLQSLVSTRVKSAVTDENEVFSWDAPKDIDLSNELEEDEDTNVPVSKQPEDEENGGPLTKEEFEKLVVQCPNDIERWCRYINYYIGQNEIIKAKELCERALESIDHKIEDNKLKIWTLKLKIEYKHGSSESLEELIKQAKCANDELKIYQNMIKIYEEDGKTELAEQVYRESTKKFPLNKSLWVAFGKFYLKNGRVTSFRDLFLRCINYMDKKEQLDLIVKFAQLECQYGDLERAKTMFEAALVNFPKRTDIWSTYIDLMIKYNLKEEEGIIRRDSIESIRLLFDRAIAIKIKEKKIRFLFQKYIDFEKRYGDEEKIAIINKKMSEYVDANDIIY
ncbi:protein RRP5 homolog [Tetranychus urticae]|uniref:rRNA biogenesis protein RRP5 n=1 Tax=Tetranychus urticae TaxID=32264 RepID=T1KK73_TETUR|nr:protein RRP5 homolog [Tetranychus urticae]